jgi:hypothetical protein
LELCSSVWLPAVNPEEVRITGESDLGFGASLEYQFSSLLGLEVGAFRASPKVEISADIPGYGHISLTDAMATTVITLDLDFHLTPGSPYFDFVLGAGLANLSYGDLHYYIDPDGDPLDITVSNDLTYSAKAISRSARTAIGRLSEASATSGRTSRSRRWTHQATVRLRLTSIFSRSQSAWPTVSKSGQDIGSIFNNGRW